jgi:hypothetical protein
MINKNLLEDNQRILNMLMAIENNKSYNTK